MKAVSVLLWCIFCRLFSCLKWAVNVSGVLPFPLVLKSFCGIDSADTNVIFMFFVFVDNRYVTPLGHGLRRGIVG